MTPPVNFDSLTKPLIGLPVSLPWKGYGSTIFLELGQLAPLETNRRRHHNKGEACIWIDWDWRVEEGSTVLYGSSNSGPEIEQGIGKLQGSTIQSLVITGSVPEIAIGFSNGRILRSAVMTSGNPEWRIRLQDEHWLHATDGRLVVDDGMSPDNSDEENRAFALAEETAARWGTPLTEPKLGYCRNCKHYVRLDGTGHLLDYGVCIAQGGHFDGHVVSVTSGCPLFSCVEER